MKFKKLCIPCGMNLLPDFPSFLFISCLESSLLDVDAIDAKLVAASESLGEKYKSLSFDGNVSSLGNVIGLRFGLLLGWRL